MRTRSMTARALAASPVEPAARSRAGRATTSRALRNGGIMKRKKAAMPKRKKPAATASKRQKPAATASKGKNPAATASKGRKGRKRKLWEATAILKLKKDAFEAHRHLWEQINVPGALERYIKAKEEEDKAEAARPKKRKVLKTKVPSSLIDIMRLYPYRCIPELTADDLANRPESFRRMYGIRTYMDLKMRDYENALIKQHEENGYALDETEVTDDDQD